MVSSATPLGPCKAFSRIKLLSCDVDGVLTDGGLFYSTTGERTARFNVLDGMGLKLVQRTGVKLAFISQSTTNYIQARARDLGVDFCYTGVDTKETTMVKILEETGLFWDEVCHIADDVNDLSLLKRVGIKVTVPNGMASIRELCDYTTHASGGNGAVRELCEAIIASKT